MWISRWESSDYIIQMIQDILYLWTCFFFAYFLTHVQTPHLCENQCFTSRERSTAKWSLGQSFSCRDTRPMPFEIFLVTVWRCIIIKQANRNHQNPMNKKVWRCLECFWQWDFKGLHTAGTAQAPLLARKTRRLKGFLPAAKLIFSSCSMRRFAAAHAREFYGQKRESSCVVLTKEMAVLGTDHSLASFQKLSTYCSAAQSRSRWRCKSIDETLSDASAERRWILFQARCEELSVLWQAYWTSSRRLLCKPPPMQVVRKTLQVENHEPSRLGSLGAK